MALSPAEGKRAGRWTMSRFSSSWLQEHQKKPEVDLEEAGGTWLFPTWASLDRFDEAMANAEDQVLASLALPTSWVQRRSKDVAASAQAGFEASRRFRFFLLWLLVALFFFTLAFVIGLPVLVLRPQKFALCFTLGSIAYMGAFAAFRGLRAQLSMLFRRDRALFTLAYLTTMILTLHAAVVLRSFLLTVLASTAQFTTLLYYLGTFIPGGYRGVKAFLTAATKTLRIILKPILSACFHCCLRAFQ